MRCYFMRDGPIATFEELPDFSDEEAVYKAYCLFSERKDKFDGFEVWDGARVIARHPWAR
jgi:hypothetical protein